MRRGRFRWSMLLAGLLASLLAHVFYIVPDIIGPMLLKPPPPELEVAYVPEIADPPAPDEKRKPEKAPADEPNKKAKQLKPEPEKLAKAPEPEKLAELKPKPVEVVPPPKPEPPPPPQPLVDHRKQMVDQDRFPDEADNAEARYLAQKNHRAEKETTARNTNLLRNVEGAEKPQTEKSDNKAPDPGMKDQKLAELQNRPGVEHEVVRSSPRAGQENQPDNAPPQKPGPLSMRNLTPKALAQAPEKTREGLELQEKERGDLPMARVGKDGERAATAPRGNMANLRLDNHAYDNIVGVEASEAERRAAARAEKSHAGGHWDRLQAKMAAVRSSIENFVSEVKPGNQEELGTRASPFAAYITAMHRQIHKLFTLGFLSDIDLRRDGAFADESLWTQLEIVLKGDGTVDAVHIVRTSGVLAFDVAAIDSVMSAAPFPTPPSVIKSANGKVYLDWQFHRDERACGTFGVDPHILTKVGENNDHDTSETGAAWKARRKAGGGGSTGEGPRSLKREPTERPEGREELPGAAAPAPTVVVPEVTSEARAAAEGWFAAYARGQADWLAGWSATPFTSAGNVVARDAAALHALYKQLLAEAPARRKVDHVEVLTPAGIRGRLGGLPPGGSPSEMLFAVGKVGGDDFILLLRKATSGWRVTGLDR